MKKPDVHDYLDFRLYLKDWVIYQKSRNPRWSYGVWAKKLGLSAKSTLVMIMGGKRNPGPELTAKIIQSLDIDEDQARRFRELVSVEKKTRDPMLRMVLLNPKAVSQDSDGVSPRWLYLVLRELVREREFEEGGSWIESRVLRKSHAKDIRKAIEALLSEGVLERDRQTALVSGKSPSPVAWTKEEILHFHRDGADASMTAMKTLSPDERVFQTSFLRVRREQMEAARELIQKFQKDLGALLEDDSGEEVYQFNLQLFPVTTRKRP